MSKVLIHGENVFIPVKKIPKGTISKHKLYIAGHSETGHHHVLESDVEFEVIEPENMSNELFFKLVAPAKVTHKKTFEVHETKTLEPGLYKRVFATEYNPFTKVIERVFD
jgi:hypothetical protein